MSANAIKNHFFGTRIIQRSIITCNVDASVFFPSAFEFVVSKERIEGVLTETTYAFYELFSNISR